MMMIPFVWKWMQWHDWSLNLLTTMLQSSMFATSLWRHPLSVHMSYMLSVLICGMDMWSNLCFMVPSSSLFGQAENFSTPHCRRLSFFYLVSLGMGWRRIWLVVFLLVFICICIFFNPLCQKQIYQRFQRTADKKERNNEKWNKKIIR